MDDIYPNLGERHWKGHSGFFEIDEKSAVKATHIIFIVISQESHTNVHFRNTTELHVGFQRT